MKSGERLRILELVDSLGQGGMENQITRLAPLLADRGIDLSFCCLRERGVLADRLDPSVPVTALRKTPGFHFSTVGSIQKWIRQSAPHLIHTHNLGPLIYASLARGLSGEPPILHGEHAEPAAWELTAKRRLQRKFLYRGCAAIHSVGEELRRRMQEAGFRHQHFFAIPNGVDTELFQPTSTASPIRRQLGWQDGSLVIGMVGRFGPHKRHLELIEGFERWLEGRSAETPARLLLLGDDGPMKQAVTERLQSSSVREQIHWAGFQTDTAPWYQAMDLLVVPSANEGMSNAVLEAMACGIPVLSHENCGAREMLGGGTGTSGWIKALPDPEAIAEALDAFARLPAAVRKNAGEASRRVMENQFSLPATAERYAEIFYKILNSAKT